MIKEKKTKLSIYLLKEGVNKKDVIKNDDLGELEIEGGTLYFKKTKQSHPAWYKSFFHGKIGNFNPLSQSSSALYFKNITVGDEEHTFLLPFGYGHAMINNVLCVEDFGLKITLNIVKRDSIRTIKTRTLTSDPRNTTEQLTKIGDISDFGIDVEQDLVTEVTGKPDNKFKDSFGTSNVIGKAAFTITKDVHLGNLKPFLKTCLEHYNKKTYEKDFKFIDRIKSIKDRAKYDEILLRHINNDKSEKDIHLWMSIPEIIEWERVQEFSFDEKGTSPESDISYEYFQREKLDKNSEEINIEFMKRNKVFALDSDNKTQYSWSILSCLCCEIIQNNETFILSNGKWYEINKDFVKEVNASYDKIMNKSNIMQKSIDDETRLCKANKKETEPNYNIRVAEDKGLIMMDRKCVQHGIPSTSIEVCDLYDSKDKAFIHIKVYSGSSALSHLFAQGLVSGELFLQDGGFRDQAIKKLKKLGEVIKEKFPLPTANTKPKPADYKIIFGIIDARKKEFDLPFFSKVNLKHQCKSLNKIGYSNIYLVKIPRQTS